MDAVDRIYQSWAYDALGSIKAKTLILAGSIDLLNPEYEAMQAARRIPGAKYVAINDRRPMGHLSEAGATAPENELQNRGITAFLDAVALR